MSDIVMGVVAFAVILFVVWIKLATAPHDSEVWRRAFRSWRRAWRRTGDG